jgi:hypothetical protein
MRTKRSSHAPDIGKFYPISFLENFQRKLAGCQAGSASRKVSINSSFDEL